MACLELCTKRPASLSLLGTRQSPKAFLPNRALQTYEFTFLRTSSHQTPWMVAISKYWMHIYFVLMYQSPEFLVVQRSRSLISLFPAWRKTRVLSFGQLTGNFQAWLVLNCSTWLIAWQRLLPQCYSRKYEPSAQVWILSDISQKGFNYPFDVLILFVNFFIKWGEGTHVNESVFILKPHDLHDFIGHVVLDLMK